jgi:hypothetical protein
MAPRIVSGVRYYTLDEATEALPRVRAQVERIRALIAQASPRDARAGAGGNGHVPSSNGHGSGGGVDAELGSLLEELQRDGIVLRDPGRGLIDFPAQSPSGREYLLCWLDGEDAIEWWHWPDAGFAGRTPLSRPPE